jgi:hypothetical protein
MRLARVDLVTLAQLEAYDPELAAARRNRTTVEYYFTCKPVLMRYVLEHFEAPSRVTYLDSDLCYFNNPASLDKEIEGSSVALTPHRFSKGVEDRRRYGIFNAGWVSASVGDEGAEFLKWWRQSCIDWCRTIVERDRFADQKYLDRVPGLFPRCHVVTSPGSNVGPWNVAGRGFVVSEGKLLIDGGPLVFYHFHAFRRVWWRFYDSGLLGYGAPLTPMLRDYLYSPYLHALTRLEKKALQVSAGARGGTAGRFGRQGIVDRWRPRSSPRVIWGLLRSRTGMFLY